MDADGELKTRRKAAKVTERELKLIEAKAQEELDNCEHRCDVSVNESKKNRKRVKKIKQRWDGFGENGCPRFSDDTGADFDFFWLSLDRIKEDFARVKNTRILHVGPDCLKSESGEGR